MANNKYMILFPVPSAKDKCWGELVGSLETARKSVDGTMAVVKMPVGKTKMKLVLSVRVKGLKTYNHKDILVEMSKSEWSVPEL